ncbi:GMC oxidoreductase [Bdellovibrio sp. HCB2-146]|uniref:GMC oxidoreductase n=1 Tax=Bdellovibrio sp. HCB2-146 TaxID=3394362 RepID=UPI0039BCB69B
MELNFDFIVIGSGFGGSVMSCRLAEKGYKVCLLERGRHWKMHEFPRRPHEIQKNMFWDPKDKKFGLMEFRDNPDSDVMTLTASGLGGGSLIYANVLYRMPSEFFKDWPAPFNRAQLDPYYDKVLNVMEAKSYPVDDPYYKNTPKTQALKKTAEELSQTEEMTAKPQFNLPPLAVRFEGEFPGQQTRNAHGALQSRCNKCGECDLGCNIHAKNTLDLNYIYRAQHLPNKIEVRTQAEVVRIEDFKTYYQVSYVVPEFPLEEIKITAQKVIVSAGSVGSTSLLLKMKMQGHLPRLNSFLGKKWCGNGDLLGIVLDSKNQADPTTGPVITGAIEYKYKPYPDAYPHGMYIEDAGFPIGMAWYLSGKIPQVKTIWGSLQLVCKNVGRFLRKILRLPQKLAEINLGDDFAKAIDRADFVRRGFLLLGMGRDRADGELQLREDGEAILKWKLTASQLHYDRMRTEMKRITTNMGGDFLDNPLTYLDKVIAVHPLGGCPMGTNESEGFVNTKGEVYGHPGLYVVDGSIIPTSIGPNPSLTIAAIAEYMAEQIPAKSAVKTESAESAM